MTLSRTARILIAVLLLAAAAFFWVNFFSQEPPSNAPIVASTSPSATPAGSTVSSPTPAATTTAPSTASGTPTVTAPSAVPSASTSGAGAQPSSAATTGTVVAPTRPAVATRDLQVAELPFLVTQPPATTSTGASAGSTANAASSAGNGQQTASAQRMTVNPFSPIVVAAPAPAQQPAAQPPASQPVITATAPTGPAAQPKLAEAPAPQPVAPPPPQASGLPRALPSGMLPTTPSVLQTTRAQASSSAPKDLGAVAAVREPENGTSQSSPLATIGQSGLVTSSPSLPSVLGPGQPSQAAAAGTTGGTTAGNGNAPLQAGTDSLSRYLRDNNVRFTGTVLGPVSVGVFRSDQYKLPVVVPLGQVLPDTHITLTDLRGHEAVFTLNDATQSLSLDLRR